MAECEYCERTFVHYRAACQHMNALGHWVCQTCDETFSTEEDCEYHMDNWCSWPFECETCDLVFRNEEDVDEHMDEEEHWGARYKCETCNDRFYSSQDARLHMDSNNHWRTHWCGSCKRGFQNANNLQMHLNSKIHRGSQITCPFCARNFTTATGVAHHLERGSCANARGVNRDTILAEIRKRDPHHVITKKLLTYGTWEATTDTWNGDWYECYLCHKEFGQLSSLNQHLNSAAHVQNVYHCVGRNCSKEFATLGALFNHLESETCGAVRFETVQRNVGGFFDGSRRMIAF